MPKEFTLLKIVAVVSCLCRLHKFLIDAGEDSVPRYYSEEDEWALAVGSTLILVVFGFWINRLPRRKSYILAKIPKHASKIARRARQWQKPPSRQNSPWRKIAR